MAVTNKRKVRKKVNISDSLTPITLNDKAKLAMLKELARGNKEGEIGYLYNLIEYHYGYI